MLNDQHIVNNDEKYLDEDWDSQDSNREDHDHFEYPEGEENDDDYGAQGGGAFSDDEDNEFRKAKQDDIYD